MSTDNKSDISVSDEAGISDVDFTFESLEEVFAPDVHMSCACTTSCKCSSCSCVVYW